MSKQGPSKIQKYNNFSDQARAAEKRADWLYAAKLWRAALDIARLAFWAEKETWCANRASFCEKMQQRAQA